MGLSILLIEDHRELARLIQQDLEQNGYTVLLAGNGQAAMGQFSETTPDLIILDWMLPDMDGMDVLRQIRRSSSVPVLMLTARGNTIDRVVGLENGADDYLVKPFDPLELLARVHALLRRVELIRQTLINDTKQPDSRLSEHGLTLDPDAHTVTLNGSPLDLTQIEFNLLQLFLRYPGRTFNRIYLLETVWGQSYLEGDRAVDNTILRLRKKLAGAEDLIETIRGIGYRLKVPS